MSDSQVFGGLDSGKGWLASRRTEAFQERAEMNRYRSAFLKIMVGLAALFQFAIAGVAVGSENDQARLADFAGDWESNGITFGQAAHSILRWHPALNGKFMHVEYEIKSADNLDAQPIFKGLGFYQMSGKTSLKAFWADSSGDLHPITARIKGRTLVSTWGVAGGKLGRTHYKLNRAGQMEVTDWLLHEDGWKQFNHNIFSRIKPMLE